MANYDNKVLTGAGLASVWAKIKAQLATKADTGHSHAIADVTGLQTALNEKATKSEIAGLQGAMHFKGTTTTALTDGSATPSGGLTIDSAAVTAFAAGDVVINGSDEWVYGSDNKWHKFGNASGYLTDASAQGTYVKKSSVAAKSTTLAYGQEKEVANIDGKSIKVTLPAATPVVDNLASTSATSALSANQGKELKALIDGKAASDHNHNSGDITAMTGYQKATAASAVSATDSLNTAIGKLEKALDGKANVDGSATGSTAGLMSAADKAKLDGIAEHANNYTLPQATESALGGVMLLATADINTICV